MAALSFRRINVQKGRVDLLDFFNPPSTIVSAHKVKPLLSRKDVWPLIRQESLPLHRLRKCPPKFILMDSFSELTDQLFLHVRSGRYWTSHFTDVLPSVLEGGVARSLGLIPSTELKTVYRNYLVSLSSAWGDIPIVFIHYPTYRETRPELVQRAQAISDATQVLSRDFNLLEIRASEEDIVASRKSTFNDSFPYHYPDPLKVKMAEKLRNSMLVEGII